MSQPNPACRNAFSYHIPSKIFISFKAVLAVTKNDCTNDFFLTFGKLIVSENQLVSCQKKAWIIYSGTLSGQSSVETPVANVHYLRSGKIKSAAQD